jgi:RimJ/RimL family protein N-acetyltransferase
MDEADVPALYEVFGDPEVMRYWSSPPLRDHEAARELLRDIHELFRARTLFRWGIARRPDGLVIGTCTLLHLDAAHGRAEVGYALGRSAWGHGLATEALGTLIRFAFDGLGLQRLEADTDPRNERSIRVLERHGFRREGYLRERYHLGGEVADTLFLGLLRREWPGTALPRA